MRNLIIALSFSLFADISFGQTNPYDVLTKPSKELSTEISTKSEFAKQFPNINIVDWKPGIRFMVEPLRDKSMSSLYKINLSPYHSKDSYSQQLGQADYEWKAFTYQGLEQRNVDCPRGACQRTYLIFVCEGKKYEFEFVGDTTELRNAKVFNSIDKLVYLDEVDKVKQLLVGKTLYIMTSQWLRDDDKGQGRYDFANPKFAAVTVISVGLGSQDGPSKIVFKQNGLENEAYLNIRLSGINMASGVFGIDFDEVFQFDDPKLKYPNIKNDIWTIIQNNKVSVGMTKQECELSWGKPKDINKTVTGYDVSEQWVYGSSSYLYFKNGILETIQN
jgi:hypothetical protein